MILIYFTTLLFLVASFYSILSIHKDIPHYVTITKALTGISLLMIIMLGYYLPFYENNIHKIHIFTFFYLVILFLTLLILYMALSQWNNDFRSLSAILIPLNTIISIISLFFINSPRFMVIETNNDIMIIHIVLALLGEVLFLLLLLPQHYTSLYHGNYKKNFP